MKRKAEEEELKKEQIASKNATDPQNGKKSDKQAPERQKDIDESIRNTEEDLVRKQYRVS